MTRQVRENIKQSRYFFVRSYRWVIRLLLISLVVNMGLSLSIYYAYYRLPDRQYYATSGVEPPIELNALLSANESDQALLLPDPIEDDDTRDIPT
jgi:intracellular multiplication protein IcmM